MSARRRGITAALEMIAVTGLLILLGLHYSRLFPEVGTQWDLWFGLDVARVNLWIDDPTYWERGHLHPLLVPALKLYGVVLAGIGLLPPAWMLPARALPLIIVIALCVVAAAHLIAHACGRESWAPGVVIVLLGIGPLTIFGPIPESHPVSGALLLLQGALLLVWLGNGDRATRERLALGAIAAGTLATGMTVSCALPAAIVAAPMLWSMRQQRRVLAAGLAIPGIVVLGLVAGMVGTRGDVDELAAVDRLFFHAPTAHTVRLSFEGLVPAQFGTPMPELSTWHNPFIDRQVTSIDRAAPSALQIAALLAWLAAIVVALRVYDLPRRSVPFAAVCGAALLSQVTFHSVYAAAEAYTLSAYAWPYIVLPGAIVVAGGSGRRRRWAVVLAGIAVALSAAQSGRAILALDAMVGRIGIETAETH